MVSHLLVSLPLQLEILMKALQTLVAGELLHVTDPPQFSLIAFDFFPVKKRLLVRQWKKAVSLNLEQDRDTVLIDPSAEKDRSESEFWIAKPQFRLVKRNATLVLSLVLLLN